MKRLLIILSLSFFFIQCDHKDHKDHHHHGHSDPQKDLSLDNGQKWKADAPAYDGVQSIDTLVSDLHSKEEPSVEDYRQLGADISANLKLIFKECKMEGEGHNQLHTILHAIMTDAKELSEVKDVRDGDLLLHQAQDHVNTFYEYFEKP